MTTIQRQITSATKAICLAKDETGAVGAECSRLQKEIELKTSTIEGHRLGLRRAKQELLSLESLSAKYGEKLAKHSTKVQETEQKNAVRQELEATMGKLRKLREKNKSFHTPLGVVALPSSLHGAELEYLNGAGTGTFDGHRQEALMDQKARMDATRELLEEENATLQHKVNCACVHVCVQVCAVHMCV